MRHYIHFDEVPTRPITRVTGNVENLEKRVTAEVSFRPQLKNRRQASIFGSGPQDSAVHVSLSSDSLVKQPGTWRFLPTGNRRASKKSQHPKTIGRVFTVSVRSFRGTPSRPKAGGAPYEGFIVSPLNPCQHWRAERKAENPSAKKAPFPRPYVGVIFVRSRCCVAKARPAEQTA